MKTKKENDYYIWDLCPMLNPKYHESDTDESSSRWYSLPEYGSFIAFKTTDILAKFDLIDKLQNQIKYDYYHDCLGEPEQLVYVIKINKDKLYTRAGELKTWIMQSIQEWLEAK